MRICLVGDFSQNHDEGLKNIAHYLAEELSAHHEVLRFNIKEFYSVRHLITLKKFKPQLIHYIPGPTIKSFYITKILGRYCKAKTVMSAPQPIISPFFKNLIYLARPTYLLLQSKSSEVMFNSLGIKTKFLSNGVDINKFKPVSRAKKVELRNKYGIEEDKFTILHVGHLMERRNLEVFQKIKNEDNQIIIVASEYLNFDGEMFKQLNNSGCIIFKGYYKNIEEIYALADCYVFPVKKGYTILTPLSVLEAMSANLIVISTKFKGLIEIFSEGNGLLFVENEGDIISKLKIVRNQEVKTRDKVLPYSWDNISEELVKIYTEVLNQ